MTSRATTTRAPRTSSLAGAVAVLVLLVLAGGFAAHGAWSAAGPGSGAVKASTLAVPTVEATRSTTSPTSAVEVRWAAPGQLPGVAYTVTRNGTGISCSSSPCTDSGLSPDTRYEYVVTARLGAWRASSTPVAVTTQTAAQPATAYTLSAPSTMTAGTASTVTVTARRADGSVDTSYSGSKSVTWSGAATASPPGAPAPGTAPTLPATVTFVNGVATDVPVTLTNAGVNQTLTVASGALSGSSTVTVNAAAASRLGFTSTSTTNGDKVVVSLPCALGCAAPNLGNGGSLTTKVSVVDAYGNIAAVVSSDLVVSLTRSPVSGTLTPSSGSVTIPAGSATSAGFVTLTEGTASYSTTLTAATTAPTSYASVSATIKKNN